MQCIVKSGQETCGACKQVVRLSRKQRKDLWEVATRQRKHNWNPIDPAQHELMPGELALEESEMEAVTVTIVIHQIVSEEHKE